MTKLAHVSNLLDAIYSHIVATSVAARRLDSKLETIGASETMAQFYEVLDDLEQLLMDVEAYESEIVED